MSKTPEEMAEEYVWKHYGYSAINHQLDFLAGYKAGCENTQTQLAVGEKTIRELLGKPQWISVKDRLPEHFEDVLTFEDGECYRVNSISELTKYWWDSDEGFERNPSYWMPLPAPPKEEE